MKWGTRIQRSRAAAAWSARCAWGVSAVDGLAGEVGRCGFVLDVAADGARVIAAVEAAGEPWRHVDSGGHALAGDQVAVGDVAASRITVISPRACRVSSNAWWVATLRPRAGPASCSSSAPVQTLVVQAAEEEILRIQPVIAGLDTSPRMPAPPGATSTSSGGWSSRV